MININDNPEYIHFFELSKKEAYIGASVDSQTSSNLAQYYIDINSIEFVFYDFNEKRFCEIIFLDDEGFLLTTTKKNEFRNSLYVISKLKFEDAIRNSKLNNIILSEKRINIKDIPVEELEDSFSILLDPLVPSPSDRIETKRYTIERFNGFI